MPNLFAFEDPVLTRWLVAVGDHVSAGQDIAAVELDKAEALVGAPTSGRITCLLADVGDHVDDGDVIAQIDEDDDLTPDGSPPG